MKKAWKWLLGIVIVLLVVGALVAIPLVMRRTMLVRVNTGNPPALRTWNAPDAPQLQPKNDRDFGKWPGNRRGFAQFGRGRMPFGMFGMGLMMFGMFFRLVIPLALIGLLLFGVYQLGKNAGARSALPPAPVSQPNPAVDETNTNQPVG